MFSTLYSFTIYLQFFQLFMLFWVMNFIIALGQMTLAGAFASYYWAFHKPQDLPLFPVAGSLWRCFR
jgi:choline transporter-like protein 2/4/5